MDIPETRFTRLGDDRIAYQIVGEGPPDLLWLSGLSEPIDSRWDYPPCVGFIRRLASFSRLIMFDRRGMGGSDPVSLAALPTWEGSANDAMAVLDAVGSKRAVILGCMQGGPAAIMLAATRPERTQALILANTAARFLQDEDYPWGWPAEVGDAAVDFIAEHWGTEAMASMGFADPAVDPALGPWVAKSARMSCSAREMAAYVRHDNPTDVRQVLSSIQVPTLVLQRSNAPFFGLDQGRHLAENIPGARFVSVPGQDFYPFTKPSAEILANIEEFITGTRSHADSERALAAVLFTDIVESTRIAAAKGDQEWREVLDHHDGIVTSAVSRFGGRLVQTTGDGIVATFDGPGRAIRCAQEIRHTLLVSGIEIRAGLHTGEIECRGSDIGGIGVHVAARICDLAAPGEVLVSSVVPVLVAGSGLAFEERGAYELKGVPGAWQLYAVKD